MGHSAAEEIMKTILAVILLALPLSAQAPLDPVRVALVVKDAQSQPLRDSVIKEMQKTRTLIVGSKRNADYVIQLAGTEFSGPCNGVVVAVLTSGPSGHDIQAIAGSDWEEVAALIVKQITAEARTFQAKQGK